MERREKITYTVIGIIVLILLFMAFRKPKLVAAIENATGAPDTGPYYLTYNYPQTNLPTVNSAGATVPSQTDPNSGMPTCGCMSVAQSFFGSSKELTDYFNKSLENLADTYMESVVGNLPKWFGQYINNTTGAALSWASQQGLQSI